MHRAIQFAVLGAAAAAAAGAVSAAPKSEHIEVAPQVQLHVLDTGTIPGRAALILIPGWRLSAGIWSEQIQSFGHDRRVIAIDPRSQGDSTKTPEGDTPEQRARDLHVLLQKLDVRNCVIVGWSQGVQDVAAYVEQFGTSGLQGIVLVDSTISAGARQISKEPQQAATQLGYLPYLVDSPREFSEQMLKAIISRPLPPQQLERLVSEGLKTPSAISQAMLVADLFGIDRTPVIAKFDRPTLIIASDKSQELDEQKKMAAAIPHAQFEVVPDAAHAVFVDQPARFDALLAAFLARVSSPSG